MVFPDVSFSLRRRRRGLSSLGSPLKPKQPLLLQNHKNSLRGRDVSAPTSHINSADIFTQGQQQLKRTWSCSASVTLHIMGCDTLAVNESLFLTSTEVDAEDVYDMVRSITDPEFPQTLEELKVVNLEHIKVESKSRTIRYFQRISTRYHPVQSTQHRL